MIEHVIKANGETQAFDPKKINGWGEWAAQHEAISDQVDWGSIVLDTVEVADTIISSKDLHQILIDQCVKRNDWYYQILAGRLYSARMVKEIHGGTYPSLVEHYNKMVKFGLMEDLGYTEDELAYLDGILDHERNMNMPYFSLKTIREKYSITTFIAPRIVDTEFETPQFVYMRMAMATYSKRKESKLKMVSELYDHLSMKRISAPSPNYLNFGTAHHGYISCCLIKADDTIPSLTAADMVSYRMTALSAGIGFYPETRSVGDGVRGNRISHQGKLPYLRHTATGVSANMQAGRGGSATVFYSAYDPEFTLLTHAKNPRTPTKSRERGVDYAVMKNKFLLRKVMHDGEQIFQFNVHTAPDLVDALFDPEGDGKRFEEIYKKYESDPNFKKVYVNARDLIIDNGTQSYEVGRVYGAYIDEINRHNPHKDPIYQSNLCVAGDTKILTKNGYVEIASVVGTKQDVWNGEEWSSVDVVKTGNDQELMTVSFNGSPDITCTSYHKFYVQESYGSAPVEKRASELQAGDKMIKFDLPVIDGEKELDKAYENGFFTADGCKFDGRNIVYLYGGKRDLIDMFPTAKWVNDDQKQNRISFVVDGLESKFFVPSSEYTIESRLTWLSGLFDGDGCVARNSGNESLQLVSTNFGFLYDLQLMLQTLGIQTKVVDGSEAGLRKMPLNDGTGELGEFMCKAQKRILISSTGLHKLRQLGFTSQRLEWVGNKPQRCAEQFIKVESVTNTGERGDTYCFTETKRHMGMFNGILTGQCLEITQPTEGYEDETGLFSTDPETKGEISMCAIGAIVTPNIESDEQYESCTYHALNMIDYAITENDYPYPHMRATAMARMNAGLGMIGNAECMARQNLKYDTKEGRQYLMDMAERHAYFTIKASLKLGKEKGNAPWMHRTKWPEGWTPLDTYNRNVDELVNDPTPKYDWLTLKSDIIENGGIRNSSLIAHMPSESSSKAVGCTNGVYPIRELFMLKSDNVNVVEWVAPHNATIGGSYQSAYDTTPIEQLKFYAVIQKYTDQTTSADRWERIPPGVKVSTDSIIAQEYTAARYGAKTTYYVNTNTSSNQSCEGCSV